MTLADADGRIRHVFLRDLVLAASIGVHPQEQGVLQRVRINVDLGVAEDPAAMRDRLDSVLDYEALADQVRAIVTGRHTNLVETVAERIATACLTDARVRVARVRVEKLDVFVDAVAAGVEIERKRHPPAGQSR